MDTKKNLALELELTKIGVYDTNINGSNTATAAAVFAVNAVGKIPIMDSLHLFGKAGAGYARTFLEDRAQGKEVGSFSPDFGVGFQYNTDNHLALRFSWSRYYYTAGIVQGIGVPTINQRTSAEISGITLIYR